MHHFSSLRFRLEAESVVTLDPLHQLVGFDSALRTAPGQSLIWLRGTVEEANLNLSFRVQGSTPMEVKVPFRSEGMVEDSFSPQVRLSGLHLDQNLDRALV